MGKNVYEFVRKSDVEIDHSSLEVLRDVNMQGKERPWRDKQLRKLKMAEHFRHAKMHSKANRMYWCGTSLGFKKYDDWKLKLFTANFCQIRLCPMCTWRRSLKIAAQNKKIVTYANEHRNLRWLFLTLTVKNCEGENLKAVLGDITKAWNLMAKRARFKKSIIGWFRGIEVTKNKQTGLYHPHMHVLLCVSPRYFKTDLYIKQNEWMEMWKETSKLDYIPTVDIRAVKARQTEKSTEEICEEVEESIMNDEQEMQGVLLEVSKYAVKDSDIVEDDPMKGARTVYTLDDALAFKRLIAYGGYLKEIKTLLGLEDAESDSADLIHTDDEKEEDDVAEEIEKVMVKWHFGLKNYVVLGNEDIKKESPVQEIQR